MSSILDWFRGPENIAKRKASDLSAARKRAWETRRAKYGPRGHGSSYSRPMPSHEQYDRMLRLIIELHIDAVLSEGQVAKATGLDRVTIRTMADDITNATPEVPNP